MINTTNPSNYVANPLDEYSSANVNNKSWFGDFQYDKCGRMSKVTAKSFAGILPAERYFTFDYDKRGQLITEYQRKTSADDGQRN